MRPDYLLQTRNRIKNAKEGSVFIPSDFFDIAEAKKVNMCLKRLEQTGELHRIGRGIYSVPRYSDMLSSDIPPRMDDIAKAIARKHGWTIIPSGDTALNMLGLSTQLPVIWIYVSDGPYKTYNIDGSTIQFKHTDNKNEIINIHYMTALVIQAIKALGKNNVNKHNITTIAKMLTDEDKSALYSEGQRVTAWVYEHIKQICKG